MSIKARERLLNVLILICALVLLFVVGYPQYKESLPSKVRIGIDKSYSSVPFHFAKEDSSHRYFILNKVEAEYIEIVGDPLQGIKDGLYDIAAVPWYWLLISPSINGDTVKAFGSLELQSGKTMDAILVPENSKIKRLGDLKGKRLGYQEDHEYLVNLFLAKMAEDNITRVTKVPLQYAEIENAFIDDKAEALFVIDPLRGYLIFKGSKVLFEGLISYYIIPSLPYTAIVMRKNYVKEENKLAAIRVKNAVEATLGYLMRNPQVVREVAIKMNDWTDNDNLSMNMRLPDYQRMAEVDLKGVENYQTTLVRLGIGTCGIKPTEFLFEKTDFVR